MTEQEQKAFDQMRQALKDIAEESFDKGAVECANHALTAANAVSHPQATEPAWRPIESAPRNGTLILLATDGGIVFVGKLNKHLQLWVDDEGRERFRTITYWMPLPAPPEAHHE